MTLAEPPDLNYRDLPPGDAELALLTLEAPAAPADRPREAWARIPYLAAVAQINGYVCWIEDEARPLIAQLPGDRKDRWQRFVRLRPDLAERLVALLEVLEWLSVDRPRCVRRTILRSPLIEFDARCAVEEAGMFESPYWWWHPDQPWPPATPVRQAVPRLAVRARGEHGRRRRRRPRRTRGPPADDEECDPGDPDHEGRRRREQAP
jgi:hypothetical protein